MATYLDFNASTPMDDKVLEIMIDTYKHHYGNADSRTHRFGENARKIVEDSRSIIANALSVNKNEVFFTSGATESNNIAILGLVEYANSIAKKHIISTTIEHKSVLEPLMVLRKNGFEITFIAPDESGRINPDDVIKEIRDDTLLVSVMHVNNETGIIQPVKEIGDFLKDKDILFHVDAAQSFGKIIDELKEINFDMLSICAHKMYGPQGIGALVLRRKKYQLPPIKPIMFGGGQEHGFSPGTLSTALIAGFGKACELAVQNKKENSDHYASSKTKILSILDESGVKYAVNGVQDYCISNTINISFEGVNSEAAMLATNQFCGVSNGSACSSNGYGSSYVLKSMGLPQSRISSAIRISWGTKSNDELFLNFSKMVNRIKELQ